MKSIKFLLSLSCALLIASQANASLWIRTANALSRATMRSASRVTQSLIAPRIKTAANKALSTAASRNTLITNTRTTYHNNGHTKKAQFSRARIALSGLALATVAGLEQSKAEEKVKETVKENNNNTSKDQQKLNLVLTDIIAPAILKDAKMKTPTIFSYSSKDGKNINNALEYYIYYPSPSWQIGEITLPHYLSYYIIPSLDGLTLTLTIDLPNRAHVNPLTQQILKKIEFKKNANNTCTYNNSGDDCCSVKAWHIFQYPNSPSITDIIGTKLTIVVNISNQMAKAYLNA